MPMSVDCEEDTQVSNTEQLTVKVDLSRHADSGPGVWMIPEPIIFLLYSLLRISQPHISDSLRASVNVLLLQDYFA